MSTRAIFSTSFLFLAALNLDGCTLIGLGMGALLDSGNSSMEVRPISEALQTSEGNMMLVTTKSGTTLGGKFTGIRALTRLERDSLSPAFIGITGVPTPPIIGDTIIINRRNLLSPEVHGAILEIDRHAISIIDNNADKKKILLTDLLSVRDAQGLEWPGSKAREYLLSGQVIELQSAGGLQRIPVANVKLIEAKGARYGMLILGGVGVALDVYFITSWKGIKFH